MERRQFICQALVGAGVLLGGAPALAAGAGRGSFRAPATVDAALFQGINRPENPQKLSLLEKKHQPLIEVSDNVRKGQATPVTVSVGEVLHPMSQAHYIAYVELFAGNEPAGRITFRPGFNLPRGTFHLQLNQPVTLVARAYCNLHGLWESRLEVAPA